MASSYTRLLYIIQVSFYLLPFAVCEERLLHIETVEFGRILRQHFVKLLDKTEMWNESTVRFFNCLANTKRNRCCIRWSTADIMELTNDRDQLNRRSVETDKVAQNLTLSMSWCTSEQLHQDCTLSPLLRVDWVEKTLFLITGSLFIICVNLRCWEVHIVCNYIHTTKAI